MGTRADFYVAKSGTALEWLGSIAFDGMEISLMVGEKDAGPESATSEEDFRRKVENFLDLRDDATRPEQGWPWPWNDSNMTDYAYVWTREHGLTGRRFGGDTFLVPDRDRRVDATYVFPDMTEVQNVTLGERSGVIIMRG